LKVRRNLQAVAGLGVAALACCAIAFDLEGHCGAAHALGMQMLP
jgi:hypothetical protein